MNALNTYETNQEDHETVQTIFEELTMIFQMTERVLNEWNSPGNIQFPVLLGMVAVRMGWDERQLRENDPFIRKYIRKHKEWCIARGAKGGIMRASEKQKKDEMQMTKSAIKQQIEAVIAAKTSNTPSEP